MNAKQVLLLVVCASITQAQHTEDPLCVLKECASNKPCRVMAECPTPGSCTLRAECMDNLPQWSHTGVCQIGQPILTMRDGAWADTYCGPTLPCPNSTYCNIELMDTYATCCRSDPANTVKPGMCPAPTSDNDTSYCRDTCNNDGDCRHDWKCCQVGCKRSCLPPQKENVCQAKKCPEGTYCLTPEMPPCTAPRLCYKVGDCIPCGPVCDMACTSGFEKDSLGCPICLCKPPPPTVRSGQSLNRLPLHPNVYPANGAPLNSLIWMYLWNNLLV